ncbi:MAG: tetratricopeptide repeat protein [Bryobacterales bacterium]|nr:tetratricopeptide repeat protein [Bryobacterales bacterium]
MGRVLCALAGLCLLFHPAQAATYLVLPFFNISKDANLDWMGESLAESVREALSSEGLMALERDDRIEAYSRLSLRPYSVLTKASVMKIGEELDAEMVVFGQYDVNAFPDSSENKSRGTLQITARVLDLKHLKQGPEFHELGALEDLAALQEHLAWQTLRYLKPAGAPSEAEFAQRHPAVRVDAVENYTRGLLAANADEKHRFFTQAAHLDPHYSLPDFQLGRLLWSKREYGSAAEWFQKVSPSDVHYHEANFFLGLCRYHTGNFTGAEAAFQSVARVVPLSEVYNNLAAAESRANMIPAALDNFRKALEGDSSDPLYRFNFGYALWRTGSYAAAAEYFHTVLDHDPDDAVAALLLARCEKQSGPRPGDSQTEGLERLKTNYEESAYQQLKAALQPEKQSDKPSDKSFGK